MVETKPSRSPESTELNTFTDEKKGKISNPKRYRHKKICIKTKVPELEAKTDFKGQCSDLEDCIFDLGPIALNKFSRIMKELEQYLGAT